MASEKTTGWYFRKYTLRDKERDRRKRIRNNLKHVHEVGLFLTINKTRRRGGIKFVPCDLYIYTT